eukprot:CAMPEP_0182595336 /NCGR_PEP_ID=MMETSP1324-20130603/82022_1 /TAXON_ID=236786 /ORGANISM="Florenciella sp., Strain RCC1587" /LENGTH=56 /DNA_ID=CAMNT_0024812925 /DNA_START=73 /DNA_END=239 /DNA_ORIENTATION=+
MAAALSLRAAVLGPILVRNVRRRCAPAAVAMSTASVAKLVATYAHHLVTTTRLEHT